MKFIKTKNKKLKYIKLIFIYLAMLLFIIKNNNLKISAISSINIEKTKKSKDIDKKTNKTKTEKTTSKSFILNLHRNKATEDEIIKKYYNLSQEEISSMIINDKLFKNMKLGETQEEKDKINKIEKNIKNKEEQYVRNYISIPTKENKNKPIVIINPGHGFEDPGAIEKDSTGKKIEEKILNAKISSILVKYLLQKNFEVYLVFDLKYAGINLPKKNKSLHILFDNRPPIKGNGEKKRMADASAFCIKNIIKKLKENNKDAKIASVCIHHNTTFKNDPSKPCGLIAFYSVGPTTSSNFEKNSKTLCEKFLKNCKNIYKPPNGRDVSRLATNDWVVCGFGSNNEKKEKKFDDEAAVLLELGFMCNKEELKNMLNSKKNKEMAKAMTKSLCEYFNISI